MVHVHLTTVKIFKINDRINFIISIKTIRYCNSLTILDKKLQVENCVFWTALFGIFQQLIFIAFQLAC
jgi:hypothetical protein